MLAALGRCRGPAARQLLLPTAAAAVAEQCREPRQLLPAAALAAQLQQERGIRLFEIFSKEARAERRAKLKDEMQRGYFDDFRSFRDSKGKMFAAPERLVPASHAPAFPRISALLSDGTPTVFPPAAPSSSSSSSSSSGSSGGGTAAPASLLCVAFRAGAQPMLEEWAGAFSERFRGSAGVALYELAVVEGWVMRMPPFKQLLLRSGAASAGKYALPCRHLHHFGDEEPLRQALHMANRLTGYVFLVDAQGRLRWRACGSPTEHEMATLLRCTEQLLAEQQQGQQQGKQGSRQAAAQQGQEQGQQQQPEEERIQQGVGQ